MYKFQPLNATTKFFLPAMRFELCTPGLECHLYFDWRVTETLIASNRFCIAIQLLFTKPRNSLSLFVYFFRCLIILIISHLSSISHLFVTNDRQLQPDTSVNDVTSRRKFCELKKFLSRHGPSKNFAAPVANLCNTSVWS